MFLRSDPTKTLDQVRESLEDGSETITCLNTQVAVDLTGDGIGSIAFGDQHKFEVPATPSSITALGTWLDIPGKFLDRLTPDLAQNLLVGLLRQQPGTMLVRFTDDGIVEVRDPNVRVIDPRRIVDVASRVISPEAPVVDFWTGDDFRLDVIVPAGFDTGWGGDPKENDITAGGIRLYQNRKANLAPGVSPFFRRLVCTNGMEMVDEGLKFDARGLSVENVLAELEEAAQRAFARVESDMAAFYAMRSDQVDHPERTLLRMASEQGLPDRTALRLAERIPAILDDSGHATMFDLVNLITNAANDPTIRNRTVIRRTLESTGGDIVSAHADRCGHCQSLLAS